MIRKIENLEELQFNNNTVLISSLILKWIKEKPNNKELQELNNAFASNTIYVASLHNKYMICKSVNSDYREERNNALLKLEELKEDQKQYDI